MSIARATRSEIGLGGCLQLRAAFFLAFALASSQALGNDARGYHQASIRCNGDLITVGAEAFVLLDKCGEPDFRQLVGVSRLQDVAQAGNDSLTVAAVDSVTMITEQWVYRLGRGRLARVLTVTGGVITDIRLADRQ